MHVFILLLCPFQNGETPLHFAIKGGYANYVERLLSISGIDVNIRDNVSSYNGF